MAMLVLSRKVGEEVMIGDSIHVRILEIRGNRVKLGFTAPDDVRFVRLEVARTRPVEPPLAVGAAE
jgi:carbon storage regulator